MAIVRCEEAHSPPNSNAYVGYAFPVGYPNSSSICGRTGCRNQGLVWLEQVEINRFAQGERIFGMFEEDSGKTKVRVEDRSPVLLSSVSN